MKTQSEYSSMTKYELCEAMQTANRHEMRMIHKALKKYGDGVPFMYRYPDFPIYLALVSVLICAVSVLAVWVVRALS